MTLIALLIALVLLSAMAGSVIRDVANIHADRDVRVAFVQRARDLAELDGMRKDDKIGRGGAL